MQLALAAVRSSSGSAITAGEQALWKLGGAPVDGGPAVTASVPELPALPILRGAAARRAVVAFTYRDRARRVDPYGLLLRDGFWYVLGRDHGHDELRTYRVDRISGGVAGRSATTGHSTVLRASIRARCCPPTPSSSASSSTRASPPACGSPPSAPRWSNARSAANVSSPGGATGRSRSQCRPATRRRWRPGCSGSTDHAEVLSPKAVREEFVARLRAIAAPNASGGSVRGDR